MLNAKWQHILTIVSGVGIVGLGLVSKAFNVHSTEAQVAASTAATPVLPAAAPKP